MLLRPATRLTSPSSLPCLRLSAPLPIRFQRGALPRGPSRPGSLGIWFLLKQPWSMLSPGKRRSTQKPGQQAAVTPPAPNLLEVYENQRFYGILWKAPPVLDRAGWTDCEGAPVELGTPPSDDQAHWEVVVTPGTDDDGWQYGTVFHHLEYKRPGGRSSQRFGDMVRRRLWRRRAPAGGAGAAGDDTCLRAAGGAPLKAGGLASAAESRSGAASVALAGAAGAELGAGGQDERSALSVYEAEAKAKAVRAFTSLVLDLLQRRKLWSIIPWDPAALLVLYRKHQEVYQHLQAQAYERRLFTADQAAPPSPLRPSQRTLLQDMLCAAMHSRAAYGYPMAAGHVSSVLEYVKLQTVQQLTFDAVGGVSVEANNEAVGALAGIDPEDILAAQWKNSTYRPCYYVAIDRANQCVVLSVRGSLQVGDLLSDLSAHPMEISLPGMESQGGWVHQGIFAAATYIHCSTQAALEEAARRCPGWPLLLTGHSLGGGVAALVAMLMKENELPPGMGPLHCITVGPAAVMSESLAAACEGYITSVIAGSDIVPHLSYASVESLLVEASNASPVRQWVTQAGAKMAEALGGMSLPGVSLPQVPLPAAISPISQAAAQGWAPLQDAVKRSASTAGLNRMLPFLEEGDPKAVQSAAGAARRAVKGAASGRQQQRGGKAQAGSPEPKMIPFIDLSQGEPTPPSVEAWRAQQEAKQAQQEVQLTKRSRSDAGAAVLGPSSAGLEGLLQPAPSGECMAVDEATGAAAPPQEEERQPFLLMPFGAMSDAPVLGTALAEEDARQQPPPPREQSNGPGGPAPTAADPELLYPPGRLLWIFPADEDLSGLSGGNGAEAAAGAAGPGRERVRQGDAAAGTASTAGDIELTEAGAAAAGARYHPQQQPQQPQQQQHVHGVGPAGSLEELRQESKAATAAVAAREAAHAARGERSASAGSGAGTTGAVSIEEAIEEVEAGEEPEGEPSAAQQAGIPVVVEADRRSFERILLMPDCLNDHLPDRYLQALQML